MATAVSPLNMVIISIIWWNVGVTEFRAQFSVFEIVVIYLQSVLSFGVGVRYQIFPLLYFKTDVILI